MNAVTYKLSFPNPQNHYCKVDMEFEAPSDNPVVGLPVWAPGSYLVREYAKHLEEITSNKSMKKVVKNQWQISATKGEKVTVSYLVYANEVSVRTSFITDEHAFISPTGTFMYVKGLENTEHKVDVILPSKWKKVACGLINEKNKTQVVAGNYDLLVDAPIEVGNHEEFNFSEAVVSTSNSSVDFNKLSEIWNASDKKMILIGSNFPDDKLQEVLDVIVEDESVLVLTETISNLHHVKFINSIDKLIFPLSEDEFKTLQPDVLITLGGMVISKKIKQFLRKYQPKHHWHIDKLQSLDTYFCLSEFIQEEPSKFLSEFINYTDKITSNYQSKWLSAKEKRAEKHADYLKQCTYTDLKVFETVLQTIPKKSQLQISNSSTIRYSLLFDVEPTLTVFCNRGTSGIDGSTSTAVGAAFASDKQTVFVTGDLSFFYDSNALWNTNIPNNFRIIILNNAGGGIFRFIPGPLTTNANDYFETPHNLSAEHLAKMYSFDYVSVLNNAELNTKLTDFYTVSNQPKIMEVFTPKELNDVVLKNYFKNL